MKIEINMINVEDGDAIIIMLNDKDRKSLILIDGGYKNYYPKVKKRIEEVLPDYDNKINLLICTHYDNDHIGGVEKILDDYNSKIQEIWIHKIEDNIDKTITLFEEKIKNLKQTLTLDEHKFIKSINAYENILTLEGYKDLLRVIKKIKSYDLDNKVVQAIKGQSLKNFPEFSVVSPTQEYYNLNLEALKKESVLEDLKSNIKNKSTDLPKLIELLYECYDEAGISQDYCSALEKSSLDNNVTATNMVSIVTLLNSNNKKFLFTGDAGIETFEVNTPKWDSELKDLFFLDIPHHGSKNNTSKKMLDTFNPENIFVSAKSAVNRPSTFIGKCAKTKERLKRFEVTNSNKNTWYLKIDQDGVVDIVPNE